MSTINAKYTQNQFDAATKLAFTRGFYSRKPELASSILETYFHRIREDASSKQIALNVQIDDTNKIIELNSELNKIKQKYVEALEELEKLKFNSNIFKKVI